MTVVVPISNGEGGGVKSNGNGELVVKTKDGVKFGRELREKEFLFGEGYLNLNHGSFGTYPRVVRDKLRSFQDAAEARPDDFIRYKYPKLIDESRAAMAKLLNAPLNTLVFIPNATTGVNTILRNLTYAANEHILYFSTIYGACEKTVAYMTETTPAKSVKINYTYPVEDNWLIDEFKRTVEKVESQMFEVDGVQKKGKVKIAIFDTVVSMPGVRMPFERLTEACKELGVMSLVDGAHGVGHVELDFGVFKPDFFVSNCHKWLHTPRGCAILHVPFHNQHLIRSTLPTSHGFIPANPGISSPLPKPSDPNKTAWVANFEFVGTIDNAPYLCIPTAIAFRQSLGGEAVIRGYAQAIVSKGAKIIAETLGTQVMENSTGTLGRCALANIRYPISVQTVMEVARTRGVEESEVGGMVRDWISKTLIEEYDMFVQSLFYGGAWWCRVSGQVYLEEEDFVKGAEILRIVSERVEKGEWLGEEGK